MSDHHSSFPLIGIHYWSLFNLLPCLLTLRKEGERGKWKRCVIWLKRCQVSNIILISFINRTETGRRSWRKKTELTVSGKRAEASKIENKETFRVDFWKLIARKDEFSPLLVTSDSFTVFGIFSPVWYNNFLPKLLQTLFSQTSLSDHFQLPSTRFDLLLITSHDSLHRFDSLEKKIVSELSI